MRDGDLSEECPAPDAAGIDPPGEAGAGPASDLAARIEPLPVPGRPSAREGANPDPILAPSDEPAPDTGNPEVQWEDARAGRRPAPLGWFVLIGLFLLVVGVWAIARMVTGERKLEERAEVVEALVEAEEETDKDARILMDAVEEILTRYLAATTVAERLPTVRHPGRVEPLMEDYYRTRPLEPQGLRKVDYMRPVTIGKRPFLYVRASLENGRIEPFVLEQESRFGLRVDWESGVAYQPIPIEEYLSTKPTEPMDFRVYLAKDAHYVFEFADAERYRSYFLTFKGSEEFLFGYTERGSETDRQLLEYFARSEKPILPALLRVRIPEGAAARRSVVIEELLATRWAYLEDPAKP